MLRHVCRHHTWSLDQIVADCRSCGEHVCLVVSVHVCFQRQMFAAWAESATMIYLLWASPDFSSLGYVSKAFMFNFSMSLYLFCWVIMCVTVSNVTMIVQCTIFRWNPRTTNWIRCVWNSGADNFGTQCREKSGRFASLPAYDLTELIDVIKDDILIHRLTHNATIHSTHHISHIMLQWHGMQNCLA